MIDNVIFCCPFSVFHIFHVCCKELDKTRFYSG